MADEQLILDPDSDPLALVDKPNGFNLIDHSYPPPEKSPVYAGSVSTEGESLVQNQYRNREISLTIRVYGSDLEDLNDKLRLVSRKSASITKDGGVLRRIYADGRVIDFDLLESHHEIAFNKRYQTNFIVEVSLRFVAKPFGRGPEIELDEHSETSDPNLIFVEDGTDLPGDVSGTARLLIRNDETDVDQRWAVWGVQSRNYDPASTAALYYKAEDLTTLGSATKGSGLVRHQNLQTVWDSILSLDAEGVWKTHTGAFRVFARVMKPQAADQVRLRAEWTLADGTRWTTNPTVTLNENERTFAWVLVDLGTVDIPPDQTRWNLRIAGSAASTGDILIDYINLVPLDDGYGEASSLTIQPSNPETYVAADSFGSNGTLAGKTAALGGTWQTGSGPYGMVVSNGIVTRNAVVSDDFTPTGGRWERLGTGTRAGLTVIGHMYVSQSNWWEDYLDYRSLVVRYTDSSNNLKISVTRNGSAYQFAVVKTIGGESEAIVYKPVTLSGAAVISATVLEDGSGTATIQNADMFFKPTSTAAQLQWSADEDLATGGDLASGGYGLHHQAVGTMSGAKNLFKVIAVLGSSASSAPSDAVAYPGCQLELGPSYVKRQSADGEVFGEVGRYVGNYLRVNPNQTNRFFVSMSRGNPRALGIDDGVDDLSAQLHYTPRYLVVPE